MYENRRFPLFHGKQSFDVTDFATDVPIGGNDATVVLGRIYDTPGNTPLNKAEGGLVELPGKYRNRGNPFYSYSSFAGGEPF